MRIVMVCPGDNRHTEAWVSEFAQAGHDVLVYAYPPVTRPFAGATVQTVGGSGPLARAAWLARTVRHDDPDVVSLHFASTDIAILSVLGRPLVVSVWGSDVLLELRGRRAKQAVTRFGLRRAALVVSPAAHMSERLSNLGVDKRRILTRPYGVDVSVFTPRGPIGDSLPCRVVVTRALAPVYSNDVIIRAFALTDRRELGELVFVSGGPLEPGLHNLAASLHLDQAVRFVGGGISTAVLAKELRSADIYCSMSQSDGASQSLLEAMASWLPCVVSDIQANREWIEDGVSGALVPVGDAVALAEILGRLARDSAERNRLGDAALSAVVSRGRRSQCMMEIRESVEEVYSRA